MRPSLRFACPPWLLQPLLDIGVNRLLIDCVLPGADNGVMYQNGLILGCESVPHDVQNCCWHITTPDGERGFYATDCGSLDGIKAKGYDFYMIEANHTRAELEDRLAAKEAAGQYAYERRAAVTHLSREQADEWLADNAEFGKSRVVYLHQHKGGTESNGN